MTNSPGYYGYSGGYGSDGSYGGYQYSSAESPDLNGQRSGMLRIAVAALGLVSFGVSFGSPVSLGWAVWFAVLAGAIAAVSLIPRADQHDWIAASFAVTGFLLSLEGWIRADAAGWAVVVVFVLNGLQTLAAVAALILQPGRGNGSDAMSDYAAYAQYAQAYQAYAMQYGQEQQPQAPASGQGTAQAQNATTAQTRGVAGARGQAADAAQESYEALQERYAQYGGYPAPQRGSAGAPTAAAGPDPGIPNYGRGGDAAVQRPGYQATNPEEASSN